MNSHTDYNCTYKNKGNKGGKGKSKGGGKGKGKSHQAYEQVENNQQPDDQPQGDWIFFDEGNEQADCTIEGGQALFRSGGHHEKVLNAVK